MKKDLEVLVIPDVHGRDFWREPVKEVLENSDKHIIFLGDYNDPYSYEWKSTGIKCQEYCIEVFSDIIELKKQYPNRITLLIGNHDCGYALSTDICTSRFDYRRSRDIGKLFSDNWTLFELVKKMDIGGKPFIFSHAGLSKEFAEYAYPDEFEKGGSDMVIDILNNSLKVKDARLIRNLGIYSIFRGWDGKSFGSIVWSDIHEWFAGKCHGIDDSMQVVGHTQLQNDPICINGVICDIDVRKAFYVDNEGNIKHWDSDEVVLGIDELKKKLNG